MSGWHRANSRDTVFRATASEAEFMAVGIGQVEKPLTPRRVTRRCVRLNAVGDDEDMKGIHV
jgi:hypothetical protein